MRTTLNQRLESSLLYMNRSSAALLDAQNRAASGKRILRPSDDAAGTNRALSLRSAINTLDQYSDNTEVSLSELKAADSALSQLANVIRSVRNIAVAAGDSAYTDTAREGYLAQLEGMLEEMLDIANRQCNDHYLFSGTAYDAPAVVEEEGVPGCSYSGNSGVRRSQVLSWMSVEVNIPGDRVFNFDVGTGQDVTDVFTMVTQLQEAISSGDVEAVSSQLTNIDANLDNVLGCSAEIGSRLNQLENAADKAADARLRMEEMLSATEDIDLAQAIVELQTQENAYQAALLVSSRVLELSLASLQFS